MSPDKLWGGRFSATTDQTVESFTASVDIDKRLYEVDIAGSIAHARMLTKVGVLNQNEGEQIVDGLNQIRGEIEMNKFTWSDALEDVHMNIESRLTEMIGDVGKKLHTARSRNDQVATDLRLYLRSGIEQIRYAIAELQLHLIDHAEREYDVIMPGFTHLQTAQPVTLGHHLLAWVEMLHRDDGRLRDCHKRLNVSPLGCAALAGTSYPIDREFTAEALGFDSVAKNSLDAVSDRDFLIEFNAAASLLMTHISRMGEELVLWSSAQFDFIDLGDAFCTGSSIMPQKKNPDVAELLRGKVSQVTGNLVALLMLMKSQPLTYNRDNQEDKQPLFDTLDTVAHSLSVMNAMLPNVAFKRSNMRAAAARGYATATDLADYLVNKGLPFRDAHEAVGKIVSYAVENNIELADIELKQLQLFQPEIDKDVFQALTLEGSVNARGHIGGTAPDRVKQAAIEARQLVAERLA